MSFTHINAQGEANMVDVSEKNVTTRVARAEAYINMTPETLTMILEGNHHKGDVFAVARIAGIQAAKQTSQLIPLCHPLMLSKVSVEFEAQPEKNRVRIEAMCKLAGQTGVEMEALVGVSNAALCIYDMLKAVSHDIIITDVKLVSKTGGKSDVNYQ